MKRSAYYATLYLGKPAGAYYIRGREHFRLPFADNAESAGGKGKPKPITPYLGGGLSMFWTPRYGTAIMATNWSPLCHHGLVATRKDGKRYWEDYHAVEFDLDDEAGVLTVTGRIESLPLRYERKYTFADDAVSVALVLVADGDADLVRLIENLPFAAGRRKVCGAEIVEPAGEDQETARITLACRDGAVVEISLDRDRPVHVCRDGLISHYRQYQINRAEVVLQSAFEEGRRAELSYVIRPIEARP